MNITLTIAAVSLVGNALLLNAWLGARDDATQATERRDTARSAASVCSDATEDLRKRADAQAKFAEAEIAKARKAATARQVTAQTILSTPASVPGDDCASASQRAHDWLAGRVKP